MSAKSSTFSSQFLALILNGTSISGLAQNITTSPLTTLYVSLHTSTPGASGNQTTNEAAYTSYARVGVARTTAGWVVTGNSVSPVSDIVFPQCTGGTETETFFGIGTASTGTGELLWYGSLSPTINVSTNVTPRLLAASSIQET